jgi:hypothetical protein
MAILEAVLSQSFIVDVRDKASEYAAIMRMAGFDDVQSLLAFDDGELNEMRAELASNGVPPAHAANITSLLNAQCVGSASPAPTGPIDISEDAGPSCFPRARPSATPPATPPLAPSPRSATPTSPLVALKDQPLEVRLQLSGFCFEVEDEKADGGWVRVEDCTAAVLKVLIDDKSQAFSNPNGYTYEAFRDPVTSELRQKNQKYGVRVALPPPSRAPSLPPVHCRLLVRGSLCRRCES